MVPLSQVQYNLVNFVLNAVLVILIGIDYIQYGNKDELKCHLYKIESILENLIKTLDK